MPLLSFLNNFYLCKIADKGSYNNQICHLILKYHKMEIFTLKQQMAPSNLVTETQRGCIKMHERNECNLLRAYSPSTQHHQSWIKGQHTLIDSNAMEKSYNFSLIYFDNNIFASNNFSIWNSLSSKQLYFSPSTITKCIFSCLIH